MAATIAVLSQKGGTGKTTTVRTLTDVFRRVGLSTLAIDLDPQGNATTGSGITKKEALPTVYQLLIGAATLLEVCIETPFNFDILPANRELAGAEVELIELDEREYRLKKALQQNHAEYDYVLIDCPPALNMLTVNALVAADSVLIPMQCEYYALEGLGQLMRTIELVRELLDDQRPDLADLPLSPFAHGWDNETFALGDRLLVRVPRRLASVELLTHEQRWLSTVARNLRVRVPVPVFVGRPAPSFAYPWSIVPRLNGTVLAKIPLRQRGPAVEGLAEAAAA